MDESQEMCEAVRTLLNKIQFNRLTLVREAFVEQQLSSGGAEEWSAHILKDMESWFSMLDNTFYTIERIFGDIQDTTRNCKARTVSHHRCVLFVNLKLTTTNITMLTHLWSCDTTVVARIVCVLICLVPWALSLLVTA